MSRVHLRVVPSAVRYPVVYQEWNPNTRTLETRPTIPALRLKATVLVGPDPAPGLVDNRPELRAIVDTGAPLSMFAYSTWSRWPVGTIEWLELTVGDVPFVREGGRRPSDPPNHFLTRRQYIRDGAYSCWLGRVRLAPIDDELRRLPAGEVSGWFMTMTPTSDAGEIPNLLGLHLSIQHNRRLTRDWIDDPNQFHQHWALEL
jgi:hypothetical protein